MGDPGIRLWAAHRPPPVRIIIVPLPVIVCDAHKLPRRDWPGLDAERLGDRLRSYVAPDEVPQFARAWLSHQLLQ